MPKTGPLVPYHAYMFRFWPEQQADETVWRFVLVDPQTDKRYSFASLEVLITYLTTLTQVETLPPQDLG